MFTKGKQISRASGSSLSLCNCPKVTFYEVEFKTVVMKVVANHKNCGDFLNDDQFSSFEKELTKYWGFEEKKE
jgi:hypothetical protein